MEKIKENLPEEEAKLFKRSEEPFVGVYGRVSYVYCELLDKKIPVPQPGHFRIESGVNRESELAILDKNCWINGYILGTEQSIFLCKFLAKLVLNYVAA